MSYKLALINLQNVTAGNTAVLTLDTGPTYDKINLKLSGGMTAAHIGRIEGFINGKKFFEDTAAEILSRDAYRNITADPDFLTLDWTERDARNGATEQLFSSIPSALFSSLHFEIEVLAAAPAAGKIKASCVARPMTPNPHVLVRRKRNDTFPSAGENFMMLPIGQGGGWIKRLYLKESTANTIDKVELWSGNMLLQSVSREEIEYSQKQNMKVPQAGLVVIDFVEDGNMNGMFDTGKAANEILLKMFTNAPLMPLNVTYDYIKDWRQV